MGFKKYRGDVVNVETAMMVHRILEIRCLECGLISSMGAYKVNQGAAWATFHYEAS